MLRHSAIVAVLLGLSTTGCIIVQERDRGVAQPQTVNQPAAARPAARPQPRPEPRPGSMPRRAPQPQVRPEPAPAPAPPPPRGPSIATNPALATTTARLIVTVVGGACALSVDGNDRGIGSSLNEPVALGDHEVVCLAGRDRMARRFTVREPANIPVEFRIAAPVPPAAAPSGPVDPRTLPLPLPAKR